MVIEKSLKDISWQVDEPKYREDPAYSYSTLAKFNREGFENIEHLFDKSSSPSLTFGSMVDTLLTDGEGAFKERFFSAEFPDVEDGVIRVVTDCFNEYHDTRMSLDEISDEELSLKIVNNSFRGNWKLETRIKYIREKGSTYYDMLLLANGKEVVTSKERQDAYNCVEILKTNDETRWYFQKDNPFDGIERLYQLKFKGVFENINLRCMADLMVVDHKNKRIIPCDLKTSYKPEYKFYRSFIEWCYYIQAQLYWYIIRQNLDADPYFKDFVLEDYRFIVICNKTRTPRVWSWKYTQCITDVVIGNYTLTNWRTIVKELDYYLTNNPDAPIGIVPGCNDISKWLENDR